MKTNFVFVGLIVGLLWSGCAHKEKVIDKRVAGELPIVMVHGFSGFKAFGDIEYFYNVQEALEAEGFSVFTPSLPPYAGPSSRALVLGRYIDTVLEQSGAQKVNIIAHSQGGLDSRRVISAMGYDDKVRTLITVATPHHGTRLADIATKAPAETFNPAGRLVAWMIGAIDEPPIGPEWESTSSTKAGWTPEVEKAIQAMSAEGMKAFNEKHPDPPGVNVFSVAGYSSLRSAPEWCEAIWPRPEQRDVMEPLLVAAALVLSGDPLNPELNDGVVPTESQRWGRLIGCVPADHFDQVGHLVDTMPDIISNFNHIDFYKLLAFFLRALDANAHKKSVLVKEAP